jgi:hypothetical protein
MDSDQSSEYGSLKDRCRIRVVSGIEPDDLSCGVQTGDNVAVAITRPCGSALRPVKNRLVALGLEIVGGTSDDYGAYLKAKLEEVKLVADAAGLKLI